MFAGGIVAAGSAAAQYPYRTIRYIVAFAAGGCQDVGVLILTAECRRIMSRQFVVNNRAEESTSSGTDMIAKTPPDGYTIGPGNIQTMAQSHPAQATLRSRQGSAQRIYQVERRSEAFRYQAGVANANSGVFGALLKVRLQPASAPAGNAS